jgi:heavy metal translocating P-type ATPase
LITVSKKFFFEKKNQKTFILGWDERVRLAARLTLAMLAGGFLLMALVWRWCFPAADAVAGLLAGAAALLVSPPVFIAAWHSLAHPSLHGVTDRLVALAMLGAWASGDLMTAAILPIVMILSHVLEERSLLGSREALAALSKLTQSKTRRLLPDGGTETIDAQMLDVGDRIELRAGDRVPVDGVVCEGEASIDAASLTGESMPVHASRGDHLMAGSVDTDGRLVLEVLRVGKDTALGKIIALMRSAESAKPPVTRLLERHAGQYLSFVVTIAAVTWFASGDSAAMLAVLVAACPCALVLAAPATAIAGIVVASRHGILIKGTAFLEKLGDANSIVFDKTGTLSTGALTLIGEVATSQHAPLPIAAALGRASNHPVSRAAVRGCRDVTIPQASELREVGGLGVTGILDGEKIAFGRPELFATLAIATPDLPDHDGPLAGVSRGGMFCGWLLFADEVRPEAQAALQDLRVLGLNRQMLLTGDHGSAAARIADLLGIKTIFSGALPEDKMHRVIAESALGYRPLVVGDGINDALALKAGAVGIAMGAEGADVALASADLVLITSDLRRLPTAIRLSRRCRQTIHVNVALGLGWTLVLMAAAATGTLGAEGAILAALLHNLSTFLGMANAGRLMLFDETFRN